MKYFETTSFDPYYNLAFEEYILLNYKDEDCIILWQNDNAIVLGVNQNPIAEINMEQADKENIKIVRRSTGGGAVYHDLGNLNFSYIADWNDGDNRTYEFFLSPIVDAFHQLGIEIEISGRNDMLIAGKKISGSAQRLKDGRILHHGTLLIESDLDRISNVLNVNKEKLSSKGIESVRSRVCNIQDHTSEKLTIDQVKNLIKEGFAKKQEIECMQLSVIELEEVQRLADVKYRSWEWTYAKSSDCEFTVKRRLEGGVVQLDLNIHDGLITDCIISGDFLSLKDVSILEKKIKGCRYERNALNDLFGKIDVEMYFGNIEKQEIVNLFFAN